VAEAIAKQDLVSQVWEQVTRAVGDLRLLPGKQVFTDPLEIAKWDRYRGMLTVRALVDMISVVRAHGPDATADERREAAE
jgi:hypothetical protein